VSHTAPGGEIHVYLCTGMPGDALIAASELLSDEERERHQRLSLARSRETDLVARALVRTTLSRYAAMAPGDWRFTSGPYGKPEVIGFSGLRFNLSHTTGLVACAVTAGADVGVDVEDTERRTDLEQVAGRFFAADEAAALRDLHDGDRRDRFFHLWTLKESYIKARGLGLSLPLRRFSFDLEGPRIGVRFAADLAERSSEWQWTLARPSGRHLLALGLHRGGGRSRQVRFFLAVPLVEVKPIEVPVVAF
jgi:4'-phosphopantetheinyl transferase